MIEAGLAAETPVALIENGTTKQQRSHLTSLSALPSDIQRLAFKFPTLIVIGQVVALAPILGPFRWEGRLDEVTPAYLDRSVP